MVLESMMNPKNAEDKPWHVFFIAVAYSLISMYFANQIFPSQASILTISLITIVFVPFFQKLFEIEEEAEDEAARGKSGDLFARHEKIIYVFSAFFMGVVVAVAFSSLFMPESTFSLQDETLRGFSGMASGSGAFSTFFINNSQVMILTFILSMMFGAGAVFILAWNASVIGVYAGNFMQVAGNGALLYGVPLSLSSIALHGIPEILAYFVAGLAGGILSVGVIRERFLSKEFKKIFKDSVALLMAAEFLVVVGAWLEAAF